MSKSNLRWTAIILGVAIILVVIAYVVNSNPAVAPVDNNGMDGDASGNIPEQIGDRYVTIEGTLRVSDNMGKGNLLLETPDKNIYINTVRDFSQLVDKPVIALIDGTQENFVLIDIQEK